MKVLFTTNTPAAYRVDFFNELGKHCDLTVLFETEQDKSRDKKWTSEQYKNFKAIFLKGLNVGNAEAVCLEVLKYLNNDYDEIIVGAYYTPTAQIAIEYMKWKHIPFVISSDGGFINRSESKAKYCIKKHYIGAADGWLSTGKTTTEYLKYYGAEDSKIWLYPFTSIKDGQILKQPVLKEEKNAIRNHLKMKEERICLSVGQFIYRKGFDLLLKAANEMSHTIGFYIIGGTPTKEYNDFVEQNNLSNVHFVGFMRKSELEEYYKAADLFVLPTREDIWGLVINEAMSYGLPVVTTDRCIAGLEMIDNGKNGFIVPVDAIEELKDAMEKILNNDIQRMSINALEKARQYTIEKMALAHMECLKGMNKE